MKKSYVQTPVCIEIETVIDMGDSRDRDRSTMTARGMMYRKEETMFFSYQEKLEIGNVTSLIKLVNDEVTITRRGAVSMRQVFIPGKRTDGMYRSPYGAIPMSTKTDEIHFDWNPDKANGILRLCYELYMQGKKTGHYFVTMKMEGASS